MTERAGLIPSRYFDHRDDLALGADEIVVVSCMRNELVRLPYFLEYYRGLGVNRFLLIDNNSDDGTREFLAEQPNVEYFRTDASYKGSGAGRMWVQELAETYATGHWVLNVDVDELLVYPGVELFGIHEFCRYLDSQGFEGLFTVMLDCYSDVPLDQTTYRSGTDFRETCPFFEVDSYRLTAGKYPPFLTVSRGPRGRLYAAGDGKPRNSFLQRKVPLVKWTRGFSFISGAHDVRFIPFADATGALLHFKYFSTWVDNMLADHARGDRKSTSYAFYKERVDHDLCFYGSQSHRYRESRDLVQLGVIAAPAALRQFYAAELRTHGEDAAVVHDLLPNSLPAEGGFTLRSIAALWPFVNNPHIARYFGELSIAPAHRQRIVRDLSRAVSLVDIWPDHILVRITRRALHDGQSGGLALAAYVDGRLVDRVMLDSTAKTLETEVGSLMPNVYRWHVDVAGAAVDAAVGTTEDVVGRSQIEVYLVDAASGFGDGTEVTFNDVRIFSRPWFHRRTAMSEVADYRGDAERYVKGDVRGWAFDVRGRNFDLPLTIYIDGRLAWYKRQTVSRPGLAAKMGVRGTAGRGFEASIPLGLFRHSGAASVEVDVRIAGTNVNLGRTPFDLPTDAEALVWERGRGWVVADPAELSAPAPTGPASPKEGRPGERVPVALRGRDRLRAAAAVAAGTARKRLTGGTES